MTPRYPELHPLAGALDGHDALLDGEIVTFDDQGRPSFERLQRRMHVRPAHEIERLAVEVPVVYIVFDLLWLDGHLTTGLPYADRRQPAHAAGARRRDVAGARRTSSVTARPRCE